MFLHTEGFTLNAEKIVYRSFAYISFTQNFLHADAQKSFIKKSVRAQTLLCKTFAHTNVKLTGAPGSFIPRRVSYTELVRYQCFWGRNLFVRKTFFGRFLYTKPNHTCFETQKLSYLWKNPCAPPRIFPRTAALKPKAFEASSHNVFLLQKDFYHFFERKLFIKIICGEFKNWFFFPYFFCSRLPKISWYCTLTHNGWERNKQEKQTTHRFGCKTIFFPGCQQKNDSLTII